MLLRPPHIHTLASVSLAVLSLRGGAESVFSLEAVAGVGAVRGEEKHSSWLNYIQPPFGGSGIPRGWGVCQAGAPSGKGLVEGGGFWS